jgi:hypothetical protein
MPDSQHGIGKALYLRRNKPSATKFGELKNSRNELQFKYGRNIRPVTLKQCWPRDISCGIYATAAIK